MANVTIHDLPPAGALSDADELPLWQTDSTKKATVADLVGPGKRVIFQVALSDLDTALTAKTLAAYFRAPAAFTLTAVRSSLATASSSGNVAVDVKVNGSTVISQALTVDAGSKTSKGSGTVPTITAPSVADDAEISFAITGPGTGAKGLIVTLIGKVA